MAFICGGLKILKFCSGAQVQGIFRLRRSGFKGLNIGGQLEEQNETGLKNMISSLDLRRAFEGICFWNFLAQCPTVT